MKNNNCLKLQKPKLSLEILKESHYQESYAYGTTFLVFSCLSKCSPRITSYSAILISIWTLAKLYVTKPEIESYFIFDVYYC